MRIPAQASPFLTQSIPSSKVDVAGFDCLLTVPTQQTKGGDYYWQHQNQLQQSALTFKPMNNKKQTPILDATPIETTEAPCKNLKPLATHSGQLVKEQTGELKQLLCKATGLPDIELTAWVSPINNTLNSIENPCKAPIKNPSAPKSIGTQETINHNRLSDKEFKTYQLFVSDRAVELTLNTTQLSQKEATSLQKLIKQWLTHQGLALKQLIINGEHQ